MAVDLANSMLKTFATEYRTVYGCEVFASHEENDKYKFPFSLKFCEVSFILSLIQLSIIQNLFVHMLPCVHMKLNSNC